MSELQLVKTVTGFRPAYQADVDRMSKIKTGALVLADVKQPRNPLFHRKFFAMLNFAFEYWEPAAENRGGLSPEKNFDRFRKDVLILAGYRKAVVNIKNEVRYEAESISFASMDQTQFTEVYSKVFSVLWRLVLRQVEGMTESVAQNAIDQMLSYD